MTSPAPPTPPRAGPVPLAWLGVWLIVALGLRLGRMPAQAHPHFDEAYYMQIAHRFAAGDGLTSQHLFTLADPQPLPTNRIWKPPGYPFVLGCWTWLAGASYRAAQTLSVLTGVCLVLVLALLGWRLCSPRAGLATGAVAALHPRLVELSTVAMPETLLTLGIAAGLLGVVTACGGRRIRWAVLGGVALGCAQTAKGTAIVPFAVLVVYVLWPRREQTLGQRLRCAAAFAGGFALPVALLAAYNVHVYGNASGGPQAVVNLAQEWIDRETLYFTPGAAVDAAEAVRDIPRRLWLMQSLYNTWDYARVVPGVFHPVMLVAAGLGLLVAWRTVPGRAASVLALVLTHFAMCGVRAHAEGRYLLLAVALACVWVGILADMAARRVNRGAWVVLAALAVVFGLATRVGDRPVLPAPADSSFPDVAAIIRGEYVGDRPPTIVARSNLFAYYANAQHVGLPVGGPDAVAQVVERWHADYVVLDGRIIAVRRRELLSWFEALPPWLERVGVVHAGVFPVLVCRVQPNRLGTSGPAPTPAGSVGAGAGAVGS